MNRRVFKEDKIPTYHRLEHYGLKAGIERGYCGMSLQSSHYMTECIGHVAYFINSF